MSYTQKLEHENQTLKDEIKKYKEYQVTDKKILSWLAKNIEWGNKELKNGASIDEIQDMLRNQTAISYLLIWPILEQRQFDGFMDVESILSASKKLGQYYNKELLTDLDDIVKYFFDRYNINKGLNNEYYKALQPNGTVPPEIKAILKNKYYSSLSLFPEKKVMLLLFVIYRYRNNIFHGNKSIERWLDYKKQINYCLFGMMKIADCMKHNNIIIPKSPKG